MGSVTAARVAAPTLLDVTPRSDTRERQAASGALRTAYLGAPAPGVGASNTNRGRVSGRGSRAYYPCRESPGSRRGHPRPAAPACVHSTPRHRRRGLCPAVHGRTLHGCPPTMEGESRRKTDVHIDVSLELWTKGTGRIAVLELRDAAAVRQPLKDRREPFSPLTLEPGTPKVSADFTLEPANGGTLQAGEGSRLTFGLRLDRNGRDRRVSLEVGAPR